MHGSEKRRSLNFKLSKVSVKTLLISKSWKNDCFRSGVPGVGGIISMDGTIDISDKSSSLRAARCGERGLTFKMHFALLLIAGIKLDKLFKIVDESCVTIVYTN